MAEATKTQSPYVRARQEWDERFGDQIKSKNNWRLAAFVSMATTLLCVTGMVAIGYRSNTVPYVVALDDVGRAVPVIPAKQVAVKDVRLQEAVVARWVTDLRTIVTDAVAQRRLVDEVYAQTGTELGGVGHRDGVLLEELALRPADESRRSMHRWNPSSSSHPKPTK